MAPKVSIRLTSVMGNLQIKNRRKLKVLSSNISGKQFKLRIVFFPVFDR
jgi:hypothetical protein